MWEYAGGIRYNFATQQILPYVKLGYGLSWYRLEDVRVHGALISSPNAAWIRKPSLLHFENILPNTWHWGVGIEYLVLRRSAPLTPGLSLKLDYSMFNHSLGLDVHDLVFSDIQTDPAIHRNSITLLAMLNL